MICCAFARLILCIFVFFSLFFQIRYTIDLNVKVLTRSGGLGTWHKWLEDTSDQCNNLLRHYNILHSASSSLGRKIFLCVSFGRAFCVTRKMCAGMWHSSVGLSVFSFGSGKKSTYSQDNQHKQATDKARVLQLFLNEDNFRAENETLLLCHKWPTGLDFSSAQLYHLNRRRRRCLGLFSAAHISGAVNCRILFYFDNMLSSSLWSVLLPHFARFTGLNYTLMLSHSDNHTFFFLSFSICLSPAPTSSHVFSLFLCCNLPAKAAATSSSRQRHDVV